VVADAVTIAFNNKRIFKGKEENRNEMESTKGQKAQKTRAAQVQLKREEKDVEEEKEGGSHSLASLALTTRQSQERKKSARNEKKGRLSFIRKGIGKEQRQTVGRGRERERLGREKSKSEHAPTYTQIHTHTIHSHTCDDLDC